jgi:hypothetical protein
VNSKLGEFMNVLLIYASKKNCPFWSEKGKERAFS